MIAQPAYPVAPAVLPVRQAVQKLWMIRHLIRAFAMDPLAADTALRPLRNHPNVRVAWLANETTREVATRFMAARSPTARGAA